MLKCILSKVGLVAAFSLAISMASPGSASAAAWFNCKPTSVFELYSTTQVSAPLLEVSCSNSISSGVNWVGIVTADYSEEQKSRFVSMASAAILAGKTFRVYYTDTQCANQANCRLVTSWSIYP